MILHQNYHLNDLIHYYINNEWKINIIKLQNEINIIKKRKNFITINVN